MDLIPYKKMGVGRGFTKNGERKKWTKNYYFEQDLLHIFASELKPSVFRSRFAGYSPAEIKWFFETIKHNAIRPKETYFHARNKLLLWLDKLLIKHTLVLIKKLTV